MSITVWIIMHESLSIKECKTDAVRTRVACQCTHRTAGPPPDVALGPPGPQRARLRCRVALTALYNLRFLGSKYPGSDTAYKEKQRCNEILKPSTAPFLLGMKRHQRISRMSTPTMHPAWIQHQPHHKPPGTIGPAVAYSSAQNGG